MNISTNHVLALFSRGVFLLILLMGLFNSPLLSAACIGDVELETQTQVNDFPLLNCAGEISGALLIQDNGLDPITNLQGLASLTTVGENLHIFDTALPDLHGLESLSSIGFNLNIRNNAELVSLNGLNGALTTIGRNLFIRNNASLANLNGLASLTAIELDIDINDNALLESFCGLFPLLESSGLMGNYNATGNAVNPSTQEILAAGPCAPSANDTDNDGVLNEVDICPDTVIPEASITKVGLFRWALLDDDTAFDTYWPFIPLSFNTTDTGGCSCEQIVESLGLRKRFFTWGCGTLLMKYWIYQYVQPEGDN